MFTFQGASKAGFEFGGIVGAPLSGATADGLRKDLREALGKVDSAGAKAEIDQIEISRLSQQCEELQLLFRGKRLECRKFQRQLVAAHHRQEKLRLKVEVVDADAAYWKQTYRLRFRLFQRSQVKMDAVTGAYDATILKLKTELANKQTEVEDREKDFNFCEEQYVKLQTQYDEEKKAHGATKETEKKANRDLENQEVYIQSIEDQLDKANKEKERLEGLETTRAQELSIERGKVRKAEGDLDAERTAHNDFREVVRRANAEIEPLKATNERLIREAAEKDARIAALEAERSNTNRSTADRDAIIAGLRLQLEQFENGTQPRIPEETDAFKDPDGPPPEDLIPPRSPSNSSESSSSASSDSGCDDDKDAVIAGLRLQLQQYEKGTRPRVPEETDTFKDPDALPPPSPSSGSESSSASSDGGSGDDKDAIIAGLRLQLQQYENGTRPRVPEETDTFKDPDASPPPSPSSSSESSNAPEEIIREVIRNVPGPVIRVPYPIIETVLDTNPLRGWFGIERNAIICLRIAIFSFIAWMVSTIRGQAYIDPNPVNAPNQGGGGNGAAEGVAAQASLAVGDESAPDGPAPGTDPVDQPPLGGQEQQSLDLEGLLGPLPEEEDRRERIPPLGGNGGGNGNGNGNGGGNGNDPVPVVLQQRPRADFWNIMDPNEQPSPSGTFFGMLLHLIVYYFIYVCICTYFERNMWLQANDATRTTLLQLLGNRNRYGHSIWHYLFAQPWASRLDRLPLLIVQLFGVKIRSYPLPG